VVGHDFVGNKARGHREDSIRSANRELIKAFDTTSIGGRDVSTPSQHVPGPSFPAMQDE
jgi:hypothetical protein